MTPRYIAGTSEDAICASDEQRDRATNENHEHLAAGR